MQKNLHVLTHPQGFQELSSISNVRWSQGLVANWLFALPDRSEWGIFAQPQSYSRVTSTRYMSSSCVTCRDFQMSTYNRYMSRYSLKNVCRHIDTCRHLVEITCPVIDRYMSTFVCMSTFFSTCRVDVCRHFSTCRVIARGPQNEFGGYFCQFYYGFS